MPENYIIIHGDTKEQRLTKTLWALISGSDIRIINTDTTDMLNEYADQSVMIIVFLQHKADEKQYLAAGLVKNEKVVGDVIGITINSSHEDRLALMAGGFDSIFDISFFEEKDLRQILLNKINRGCSRLESRINEEEYKRFQASLAASPDAFIVFDENRKLFFVSEHYKRAYTESADKLVRGLDVMDAFEMLRKQSGVTSDDPRYQKMRDFWLHLDGEEEFSLGDGRRWRVRAAKLPGGQGTIVTTTDITLYSQQKAELLKKSEEIEAALNKAQEASAIQGQFINMISHEFRTPLSIIDGNAQIILRRGLTLEPEALKKRAHTIRSAVSRLINMMEGVLSSNMLETGNLTLVPEEIDLQKMIIDACDEHEVLSPDMTIQYSVQKLPETVMLDRKVIQLVLGNLLSNAVKFSTTADPLVKVMGWSVDEGIKIRVEDNGIGIPEKEQDRIFDRYYRATTASGVPGSGIGLNLVKELVELHGGRLDIKSHVGEGTKIIFFLPYLS